MQNELCRFGILGTAAIARKNWKAIRLSGTAAVTAVASRNLESANKFIDECSADVPQIERPQAFASYEELLASPNVDAVYIPLPTALRSEWVERAAAAGKHVLAEKPASIDAAHVEQMFAVCRKNHVQYMDGVMFMHSQRLPMVRALLEDHANIGQMRRMVSQFSFAGDSEFFQNNIRVNSQLEPHGCLGDLGWYCIRAFLWTMKGEMPTEARGRMLTSLQGTGSPQPVPGEFSAELLFANGVSASFYVSFLTENQQWLHLSGSKGNLRLNDFVLPYHKSEVDAFVSNDLFCVDNCEFHMEQHQRRHAVREYDAGQSSAQEVRMICTFCDTIRSGKLDATWPDWTLKTQKVLDACFASSKQNGAAVTP